MRVSLNFLPYYNFNQNLRILWAGIGFVSKILNVGKNLVNRIDGVEKDASKGGPRVLVCHRGPMEREFVSS
jgi:hypothetical protein